MDDGAEANAPNQHVVEITGEGVRTPTASTSRDALARVSDGAAIAFLETMFSVFETDPRLTASTLRADARSATAEAVGAFWRPELTASAQSYNNGITLQASQPLLDFGKRAARVAEIRAEQAQDELATARERERLLRDGLFAVLDYNDAMERIQLHQRQIRDFEEARVAAETLVNMNLVTAAEARLAEVERQKAEVALLGAQSDALIAQRSWEDIANGANLPAVFEPQSIRNDLGAGSATEASRIAGSENLRLRALDVSLGVLEAEVESLRRRRTPTISAAIEANLGSDTEDTNAGLSITYPILTRAPAEELAETRAEIAALVAEQEAVRRDLRVEIDRLSTLSASSRALAAGQRNSVVLLEQRAEDLSFMVETGIATYTDLIEVREDIFDTELEILGHLNSARRADADILLLTGLLVP